MTADKILEEIMLLDDAERSGLFRLMQARPALRRAWEESGTAASSTSSTSKRATSSAVDSRADYLIIWDGGSRGNPGKGYGSYQLTAVRSGKSRLEKLTFPGNRMTNNEAEYQTLISALDTLATKIREHGHDPQAYKLDLRGDSQLVIYQVLGKWRAKNKRMAKCCQQVRQLLEQFGGYTLQHHGREHSVRVLGH